MNCKSYLFFLDDCYLMLGGFGGWRFCKDYPLPFDDGTTFRTLISGLGGVWRGGGGMGTSL
jgi:hypothetical protein